MATHDGILYYGETTFEIDFEDMPPEKLKKLSRIGANVIYEQSWDKVGAAVAKAIENFMDSATVPQVAHTSRFTVVVVLDFGLVRSKILPLVDVLGKHDIHLSVTPYPGIHPSLLIDGL